MRILRTVRSMTAWSASLHREGVMIGLVPTMGALHAGHRALIRKARLSCDALVVSLFVNPRQFGLREDFSRYPRRLRSDAQLCRAEGVDVLFVPTGEEMYPRGFATSVAVQSLSRRWEGTWRPGHFEGVATIVTKLCSLVRPQVTLFGQKDFQQSVLVRRTIQDLNLGARVVVCPTVRDDDGLALSSRNQSLTPAQRRAAPVLYAGLQAGLAAVRAGVRSASRITRIMRDRIATEPLARVEYLSVCDPRTLEPLSRVTRDAVLLGAIRLGRVRLIDNLLVRRDK
ncbi:MAG: pantoate--beta-alanine ligase [Candidatus Methylomirabilaceae bacterium]